jgi:hypothetical protein
LARFCLHFGLHPGRRESVPFPQKSGAMRRFSEVISRLGHEAGGAPHQCPERFWQRRTT